MLDAIEKELSIDIKEKSKRKIIDVFRLSRCIQLPVLDGQKIVGILDLFIFLDDTSNENKINIEDLMETDIIVAGRGKNVFSFKSTKQQILPFVDENDNYIGFVNRVSHKVYLPSAEYIQVIERGDEIPLGDGTDVDYEGLAKHFNLIVESNYEGLYVTVDKGKTLSINRDSVLRNDVTYDTIMKDNGIISLDKNEPENKTVSVTQLIQNRNEVNVSDEMVDEGAIIRIKNSAGNMDNVKRIEGFEKLHSELASTQKLAEQYQNELEFLRWEQKKSEEIVAESPSMKQIISLAVRIAKVDSSVLIQGPSGSGKGELSNLIHRNSNRKDGPFIKIDCGTIPDSLMESELFGYEPGAFTGAQKDGKVGLVELANGGTLFLDEIGEVPFDLQVKLLRLLQDKQFFKVGGNDPIDLDIKVIAATNRDLLDMVEHKQFRKDLYYRLNVVPIKIPPLTERQEDIKPLIDYYTDKFNKKYGQNRKIDRTALKALMDYSWPGNVRELENQIEYLVVTASTNIINKNDLPANIVSSEVLLDTFIPGDDNASMKEIMDLVEKNLLIETMRKSRGTDEMASILKVDRSTIIRKLQKHKLKTHFS